MSCKIKPHTGTLKNPLTGDHEDSDLGIDLITITEGGKVFDVGYVAREAGAVIALIRPLSDSQRAEIAKEVRGRECEKGGKFGGKTTTAEPL